MESRRPTRLPSARTLAPRRARGWLALALSLGLAASGWAGPRAAGPAAPGRLANGETRVERVIELTPAEVAARRRAARAQGEGSSAGGIQPLPAQRGAPRGLNLGGKGRSDYRIRARLDADGRTLTGEWELRWTHGGTLPAPDLWFHVYLNAFANNRSTVARTDPALAARLALEDKKGDGFGFTRITGLALVEGDREIDLLGSLTFEHPRGDVDGRTVFSVDLPEPVQPGADALVRLRFETRLPRAERRTGQKGDFLLVAQWFPKLGVWEDERGWNCHSFHAFTEWYADFGTYDVTLDLPAGYEDRVGGSGVRVSSEVRGERVEVRFQAPSEADRARSTPGMRAPLVHDFTWTADPQFATHRSTFRFAEWASRYPAEVERARAAFGPDAVLDARDVDVLVLMQPERAAQGERHAYATEAALFFYGLWFGEYPYERITVVDPAWGSRAGGMEYPTLFTAGTRLLTRPTMHVPESVTVHEAGHQWFYGMVANNEFEAAWLDEGLNSFADSEVLARVWGDRIHTTDYAGVPVNGVRMARFGAGTTGRALALREVPMGWLGIDTFTAARPLEGSGLLEWWRDQPWLTAAPRHEDPRWNDRARYLSSPDKDPIDTLAWFALDRSSHYTNSYARTAAVLRSMPAMISAAVPGADGWAAFHRAMRGFALEWRMRHPYPDDFFDALQRHLGLDLDLSFYVEECFRGTGTVDWSVSVEQTRAKGPAGWFPGPDGVYQREGSGEGNDEKDAKHEVRVVLRKQGELNLPVWVELGFEDGSVERFVWTRDQQIERGWLVWTGATASPLVFAAVDPDRGYFLDRDMSNNRWVQRGDDLAPWRWAERAGSQFLRQLHFQAGIGG